MESKTPPKPSVLSDCKCPPQPAKKPDANHGGSVSPGPGPKRKGWPDGGYQKPSNFSSTPIKPQ